MIDFILDHVVAIVVGVVVVVAVLVGTAVVGGGYYDETTQTCTVDSKDRTRDADGNTDARVYTRDCGTFKVSDTLFKGEFRSADTYGSLRAGKRYEITSYGWRVGFFSMFPNIIEVKPA